MAPTTRSASKRAADSSASPGPSKAKPKGSWKKIKKSNDAFVDARPPRCLLLEMPPETRNRIYHFCKEQTFETWFEPCALRKVTKPKEVPQYLRSRTFFSLTQTCQRVRSEYRPLWLRQSSVCISFDDVLAFISTFYLPPHNYNIWYRDAPRFLSITWDHNRSKYGDGFTLLDFKPLLKLRASTPSTKIEFRCRKLVEFDLQCVPCDACGYCINCPHEDFDDNSDVDSLYDYACSHEGTLDNVYEGLSEEYAYLAAVNDFLNNGNEAWLATLQNSLQHPMKVQCTMGRNCEIPTIYIQFDKDGAPPLLRTETAYRNVAAYLTQIGIIDLKWRTELDFVVATSTGNYVRSEVDGNLVSVYNQIHICGRTYKAPTDTAKPTATRTIA